VAVLWIVTASPPWSRSTISDRIMGWREVW